MKHPIKSSFPDEVTGGVLSKVKRKLGLLEVSKMINAETKKNASLRMPESQGVIMFSPNVVQESCVFSIVGFHSGDGYSAVNMQRVLSASTAVFLLLMVLVLEAINWDN
ncbi:uncharacterized protein LOC143242900 isoform X4 [Tachypleus tridentatus]|uniref:uncharacterized protein LOC143242900 isoform X4 n=1 Tax=Tachypleus tridentatus TaxID=6853 RepID=UPI003FD2623E